MAKLLTTASFVTQSSPATPSSGYSALYASGSSLYYKNSSGIDYNLSIVGSSSIQVYTSSADWIKPAGIQYIKVVCAGGGGGGGSGRINPIGTRGGGGGGAGGNINIAYFSSQSLTGTTYSVRVGGGGPGAIRTGGTILINGSNGVTGISSSFSTGSTVLLWGGGGPGGGGGGLANAGANTAPTTANTPNPYPPFYYSGVNGGLASTVAIPTPADPALSGTRTLAGGGAGGALSSTPIAYNGGSGSAIYNYNILVQSGSPSLSSSGLPGDNGAPVIDIASLLFYSGSNITTGVRIGTGGHGGGAGGLAVTGPSGGNGGSGSLGAGGGGGGAAVTSSVGNPIENGGGGRGGNGFVIIFEYF